MKKAAPVLLVLLLLCALPRDARGGPWIPARWHFYLQLRESVLIADRRYDASGTLRPIALVLDDSGAQAQSRYRQSLTDLYFELGLGARLAATIDFLALDYVIQPIAGRSGRSAFGASDMRIGAKLLLFDDELTATISAAVIAPIGSTTTAVPLGPGDVRTELLLLVGKLFDRPRLFLSGEIGVMLRASATVSDPQHPSLTESRQYSHALRYGLQFGYTRISARRGLQALTVAVKLEGAYAFTQPEEDGLGLLNPAAPSYTKLGPELTWTPAPHWQLSLGGHYFVAGRAIPAVGEIALGLGYAR